MSTAVTTVQAVERRVAAILKFADRLLKLFGSAVPNAARPTHPRFAQRIEQWRSRLFAETNPDAIDALTTEILVECAAHADGFHEDIEQRESEVTELMGVLRGVVETLRGDSQTFETELDRSTANIRRMVDVEDIREIKRVLSKEVDVIRKAAENRQRAEADRIGDLNLKVDALQASLRQAREQALTDPLTGIANRAAYAEEVKRRAYHVDKGGAGFALAMVDLDDLKKINDTHGHQVGDRVLIACAQILQESVPAGALVARYGGEEFVLILPGCSIDVAAAVLQSALTRIPPTYGYSLDGRSREVSFSFSAGVAVWSPGDNTDSLVRRADEALYEAKRKGKKRVETKQRGRLTSLVSWSASGSKR